LRDGVGMLTLFDNPAMYDTSPLTPSDFAKLRALEDELAGASSTWQSFAIIAAFRRENDGEERLAEVGEYLERAARSIDDHVGGGKRAVEDIASEAYAIACLLGQRQLAGAA